MTTTKLTRGPAFTTVRTEAGAIVIDSMTINTTNYPITKAFDPYEDTKSIAVYWDASGGTVAPDDYLDLQPLYYDGKSTADQWVEGAIRHGVRCKQIIEIPTMSESMMLIRVVGVVCAAGTGLLIRAAHLEE
jgi:hypothetical protein